MSEVAVRRNEFPTIWPLLLDYNRRECLQILRRLELEAYGKIVAVLRAQGPLTKEKRKILYMLQRFLSISLDRHKAEVRRALNDEELATISEAICGKEVDEDWILEGKRVSPILHRPSPKTVFLPKANRASLEQLTRNTELPNPARTASKSKSQECIRDENLNQVEDQHYSNSRASPNDKQTPSAGTVSCNHDSESKDISSTASVNMEVNKSENLEDIRTHSTALVKSLSESQSCNSSLVNVSDLSFANQRPGDQTLHPKPTEQLRRNSSSDSRNEFIVRPISRRSSGSTIEQPLTNDRPIHDSIAHIEVNSTGSTILLNKTALTSQSTSSRQTDQPVLLSDLSVVATRSCEDSKSDLSVIPTVQNPRPNPSTGVISQPAFSSPSSSSSSSSSTLQATALSSGSGKVVRSGLYGSSNQTNSQQIIFQMQRNSLEIDDPNAQTSKSHRFVSNNSSSNNNNNSVIMSKRPAITRTNSSAANHQFSHMITSSNTVNPVKYSFSVRSDRQSSQANQQTLSPTIATVQSMHTTGLSQRLPTLNTVMVSGSNPPKSAYSTHFTSGSHVFRTIPVSNLPSSYSPNVVLGSVGSIAPETVIIGDQNSRGHLFPTSTNIPSSNLTSSTSTGNVIVFQKGVGCKVVTNPNSSVKIASNINTPNQTHHPISNSTAAVCNSVPGRQIRIVGLPNMVLSPTPIRPASGSAVMESVCNPSTPTATTVPAVSSTVLQTPRLGTILEVDLDAENYNEQQQQQQQPQQHRFVSTQPPKEFTTSIISKRVEGVECSIEIHQSSDTQPITSVSKFQLRPTGDLSYSPDVTHLKNSGTVYQGNTVNPTIKFDCLKSTASSLIIQDNPSNSEVLIKEIPSSEVSVRSANEKRNSEPTGGTLTYAIQEIDSQEVSLSNPKRPRLEST